jgi:hypothetical protein
MKMTVPLLAALLLALLLKAFSIGARATALEHP